MGTTRMMWEYVSECLNGEELPAPINAAIYELIDGTAEVRLKEDYG